MKRNNLYLFLITGLFLFLFAQCANKFYKAGMDFYDAGNYKDAISQYNQWLEEDSDNAKAYVARAEAYKKLNKKEEAADDYSRAGALTDDEEVLLKASGLYFEIENYERAAKMAQKAVTADSKNIKAYKNAIKSFVKLEAYQKAYNFSSQLIELQENAGNFYWRGFVANKLNKLNRAEKDLRKAIKLSPKVVDSYVVLADVLYKAEKYDEALAICNRGLNIDKKSKPLLETRSLVFKQGVEDRGGSEEWSKILLFNSKDIETFFKRGRYYQKFNQSMNAINDFSKVISLQSDHAEAYYYRAKSHEEIANFEEAAKDYQKFLELTKKNSENKARIKEVKSKVFDLLREDHNPEIVLADSIPLEERTLRIPGDLQKLDITGYIKDESKIEFFLINGEPVELNQNSSAWAFHKNVDLSNLNKLNLKARDVYGNATSLSFTIERTEINPPEIKLKTPYASYDGKIYLQNESSMLYVEGQVKDESLIESILIEDKNASYTASLQNPTFSATINISNKDKFTVKAVDNKGNVERKEFSLDREGAKISADNPMGKTWVVFIENSDYNTFASLDGPVKDVSRIKAALANYEIHNFIHKKNMTKKQMERFFSIELRDLVKANNINSLLIWYAGHGKFINETGYWVPTDAKRDNEFSFFNINNLKASLQGYSDEITHTLVVTDACESGPSFYQAMRSIHKKRDCSNWKDTRAKSAQVFSSAGNELAVDQSQFTESFANTLVNNPNACLPIEDIVSKVTLSVTKAGRQQPKFGKIEGLEDEGGTFFFISKNK